MLYEIWKYALTTCHFDIPALQVQLWTSMVPKISGSLAHFYEVYSSDINILQIMTQTGGNYQPKEWPNQESDTLLAPKGTKITLFWCCRLRKFWKVTHFKKGNFLKSWVPKIYKRCVKDCIKYRKPHQKFLI